MGYPCDAQGGCPRDARGAPMSYSWANHGPPMGYPWDAHVMPKGDAHGMRMGYYYHYTSKYNDHFYTIRNQNGPYTSERYSFLGCPWAANAQSIAFP